MKLKTIIGTIALAASTCFGATDAELKAMLDAKDYNGFALKCSDVQLTNLLAKSDAVSVVTELSKTNMLWKTRNLIKASFIDSVDALDIYIANKNSHATYLADDTKNTDIFVDTWSKLIDIPEFNVTSIDVLIWYNYNMKSSNLELTKKTAERILRDCSLNYTRFVFSYDPLKVSSDYKLWAKECLKNVNEKTCDLTGWLSLNRRNYGMTMEYYYENMWKIKTLYDRQVVHHLFLTEYRDQAIEVLANNLQDPKTTYEQFALEVDKRMNNKEMTKRMYPVIAKDIHYGMKATIYLNDIDKVIDILLAANEELTAEELNSVIPMINALDIDYRKDDIVKALRNINGRYTLKLYDARETWEPVLSKIRALIDVRQM